MLKTEALRFTDIAFISTFCDCGSSIDILADSVIQSTQVGEFSMLQAPHRNPDVKLHDAALIFHY